MTITADHVATAIVHASRITGVDPIEVALGTTDRGGNDFRYNHARAYAALALDHCFPSNVWGHRPMLARLVGVRPSSQQTFVTGFRSRIRLNNKVAWFDAKALNRVVIAVLAVYRRPAFKPIAGESYVPVGRPVSLPGKQKLRDILAEAAANTAKLPVGNS